MASRWTSSDHVELDHRRVTERADAEPLAGTNMRRRCVGPLRGQPQAREGDQGGDRQHAAGRRRAAAGPRRARARARRRRSGSIAGCAARRITSSTATSRPSYFVFNNPESACRTCGGLGVDKLTHPELLIPDPKRSILGGCFVREAFKYNPDTWDGRVMFSLAAALEFPLDSPWNQLPEEARTRDPLRDRPEEDRADVAAGREGQARRPGRQGSRLRRNRAANRAATTAATVSEAKQAPGWRRGSTR